MRDIKQFCGIYEFLSNFFRHSFFWDGRVWKSSEHLYQALKTLDFDEQEWIRSAPTPAIAKNRGNNKKLNKDEKMRCTLRPDWDDVKIDVMRKVLKIKFSDPHMAALLRNTGDAHLEEGNWWHDTYWGVCNGKGENHLGLLLMELRKEIK
jgi:ribA/ribD-fused uncharacterized protein